MKKLMMFSLILSAFCIACITTTVHADTITVKVKIKLDANYMWGYKLGSRQGAIIYWWHHQGAWGLTSDKIIKAKFDKTNPKITTILRLCHYLQRDSKYYPMNQLTFGYGPGEVNEHTMIVLSGTEEHPTCQVIPINSAEKL